MQQRAESLTLNEDDFVPLQACTLLWRWTSLSHAAFPSQVLVRIRPLAASKAGAVNQLLIERFFTRPYELDRSRLQAVSTLATEGQAVGHVRAWLASLGRPPTETVLISWDGSTAVTVPFAVLTEYWDASLYPSSDDAVVVPLTLDWVLSWSHYELLQFGAVIPLPDLG